MAESQPLNHFDRRDLLTGAVLFLIALVALVATLDDIGMTWDESGPLNQLFVFKAYFESIASGERAFDWSELPSVFATREPHPPLHRFLALPFMWLFPGAAKLLMARMATVLSVSLTLPLVFFFARRRLSRPAAAGGALLLLLVPRFFAHAHLAALDAAVAFWWIFVIWLFFEGRNHWGIWVLATLAFVASMLVKFTCATIPGVLLLWIIFCRYGLRGARAIDKDTMLDWLLKFYLTGMIGLAGFFLLWPKFWDHTRFHVLNYITFQMEHFNPGVEYFGSIYRKYEMPPWHYPWVMLAFTLTPFHLLALAAGIAGLFRRKWDEWLILVVITAFFPLLVFSLPTTPRYDGVRLFLHAFPGLAILFGLGVDTGLSWIRKHWSHVRQSAWYPMRWSLVSAFCILTAGSVMLSHPFQLSYYNAFTGGLSGARSLGMQVTYWGDFLDKMYPELNDILRPDDSLFVLGTYGNLNYPHTMTDDPLDDYHLRPDVHLRHYGPLGIASATGGRSFVLIVQRRSAIPPKALEATRDVAPVYEYRIDGVPLAKLYRGRRVEVNGVYDLEFDTNKGSKKQGEMNMSIMEEVTKDLTAAMKAKDTTRVDALRLIRAELLKKQKEKSAAATLDNETVISVLQTMAKQRKESIEVYEQAGRDELAESERKELKIIEEYLPPAIDESTIESVIDEVIEQTGASSMKEMGKVMGLTMKRLKEMDGVFDGSVVNTKVKTRLEQ